jgi:hypothetical protein
MMQTKSNVSPERLAQLRAESQQLRPALAAEMPAVRDEWKQWVNNLTEVVARHSKEIDEYIQTHGPMTRQEVVDKALTKLLSEV